jgi:hypothetical protein
MNLGIKDKVAIVTVIKATLAMLTKCLANEPISSTSVSNGYVQ